jgi:hypothetical protein
MSVLYALYRFTHADGSAKEWAWGQHPDGKIEVRFGKAGRLGSCAMYPASDYGMIAERARSKEHKGYVYVGQRLIQRGCPVFADSNTGPEKPPPSEERKPEPNVPFIDLAQVDPDGSNFFF